VILFVHGLKYDLKDGEELEVVFKFLQQNSWILEVDKKICITESGRLIHLSG
jgi:hypothetical protein